MESVQVPEARTSEVVPRNLPSLLAILAVGLLAISLGVRIFVWVDNARPDDWSILGIVPWLAYPGIVAAIAVRSRVRWLATGVAALGPIPAFALPFGVDRTSEMGPGVSLGYAALILISVVVASRFARRRGLRGSIAAVLGGAAAFVLALGAVFLVPPFLFPVY
jgi:hypothetical protein